MTDTASDQHSSPLVGAWPGVLMNNYGTPAIGITHGEGSVLYGDDGKDYIDFLAGIAVCSLGHAHPKVVDAVTEQVKKLTHVSNLFATQPVEDVAAELIRRFARGNEEVASSSRVFFCNSGAEANEAAFKLARLTGKRRILAADKGFHGRTMGALALTGQPAKRDMFGPLPGGVEFFPFGDVDYLTTLIEINPTDVAAIIVEPIQGETGVIPAPEGFLAAVRKLCDEHEILMITDEVQTGIGRTGDFFAHQHEGVVPDVVTMAKGLGSGLPIGACLARGKAAEFFGPGSHGTTFGGNPVCCAASRVVLDTVDETLLKRVSELGERIAERLEAVDGVVQVRGRGLMLGVCLADPVAKQAVTLGLEKGVILNAPADDVIRITPPLVITDEELEQGLNRLVETIAAARSQQK